MSRSYWPRPRTTSSSTACSSTRSPGCTSPCRTRSRRRWTCGLHADPEHQLRHVPGGQAMREAASKPLGGGRGGRCRCRRRFRCGIYDGRRRGRVERPPPAGSAPAAPAGSRTYGRLPQVLTPNPVDGSFCGTAGTRCRTTPSNVESAATRCLRFQVLPRMRQQLKGSKSCPKCGKDRR